MLRSYAISGGLIHTEVSVDTTIRSPWPASVRRSMRSSISASSFTPIASYEIVTPRVASSRFASRVESWACAQVSRAGSKPSASRTASTAWVTSA
jgi:hypothetical protein